MQSKTPSSEAHIAEAAIIIALVLKVRAKKYWASKSKRWVGPVTGNKQSLLDGLT